MAKLMTVVCMGCALATLTSGQDMTSLMFQALGMDPIPMPPMMPQSLREHLYQRQPSRQDFMRQAQLQQQKQRYLAYLSAQKQRQLNPNSYSSPYTVTSRKQSQDNSVLSPANMIRQPGSANSVLSAKAANPYSVSYQEAARSPSVNKGNPSNADNPYSVSRQASSQIPTVRKSAVQRPVSSFHPAQAAKMLKTMQTMKAIREQPRKITDAKAAGCKLPIESAMASVFLFSDCKSAASRMICQSEMMSCVNVGMTPMCCPYGMNRLALDTMSYVNKLQHFMNEMA